MTGTSAEVSASPYIKFEDVQKAYANGAAVAIQGFSLEIPKGAFVSIVGPSGCGNLVLPERNVSSGS